jgi:hypothetical protein
MKIGTSAVGGRRFLRQRIGIDDVGRQPDDAAEPLGVAQPRVERDDAALREAGQHDAIRLHAARLLGGDQRLDAVARRAHAGDVGARVDVGARRSYQAGIT